jgi:glycerol transport system ATP-binding protein
VTLELKQLSLKVGGETYLHPLDLKFMSGAINVLLGPTQAGKTTLMRVIAGLDRPSSGQILVDGKDVVGISVRDRNLSMVYQQFVNYPAMTVYENIAAPLRLQHFPKDEIHQRVHEIAEKLHIDHLLKRFPGALSGGQQQRCALARALVKRAPLLLLDEPLVNLDYKLREELRMELTSLFTGSETTVVYATTEPQEALLLGGNTVVMDAGRILQTGLTLSTYNKPVSIRAAAIFNDPPMNILDAKIENNRSIRLYDGTILSIATPELDLPKDMPCKVGIRSHHVRLTGDSSQSNLLNCTVELAELSGSETYVHMQHGTSTLVAQMPGVHACTIGSAVQAYVNPEHIFLFDTEGSLLRAPKETQHGTH